MILDFGILPVEIGDCRYNLEADCIEVTIIFHGLFYRCGYAIDRILESLAVEYGVDMPWMGLNT